MYALRSPSLCLSLFPVDGFKMGLPFLHMQGELGKDGRDRQTRLSSIGARFSIVAICWRGQRSACGFVDRRAPKDRPYPRAVDTGEKIQQASCIFMVRFNKVVAWSIEHAGLLVICDNFISGFEAQRGGAVVVRRGMHSSQLWEEDLSAAAAVKVVTSGLSVQLKMEFRPQIASLQFGTNILSRSENGG